MTLVKQGSCPSCTLKFDDGTEIVLSLSDGLRLLAVMAREGWVIE